LAYIPTYLLNNSAFLTQFNQNPFTAVWNNQRGYLINVNGGINNTYFDDLNILLNDVDVDQINTWSFQAIKIGDLDFTSTIYPFKESPTPVLRGEEYTIKKSPHPCLEAGQLYEVELLATSKEDLRAYQMGARFDPNLLEVIRLEESQTKGVNDDNINFEALKKGELKFIWVDEFDGENVKIKSKKGLFKLIVRPKQNICNLAEAISLDKRVLPALGAISICPPLNEG
jgi:hypothetical protein